MGEYRAAFISAMSLFESALRDFLASSSLKKDKKRHAGLYQRFRLASEYLEFSREEIDQVYNWIERRNLILHENRRIRRSTATRFVNDILALTRRIRSAVEELERG